MADDKCDFYDTCRVNRESEIAFRASLTEQMQGAVKAIENIGKTIKENNEKYWSAIGKLNSQVEQECKDRISADGHIESKAALERGKLIGYSIVISAIIATGGIILTKLISGG